MKTANGEHGNGAQAWTRLEAKEDLYRLHRKRTPKRYFLHNKRKHSQLNKDWPEKTVMLTNSKRASGWYVTVRGLLDNMRRLKQSWLPNHADENSLLYKA